MPRLRRVPCGKTQRRSFANLPPERRALGEAFLDYAMLGQKKKKSEKTYLRHKNVVMNALMR